MTTIYCWAATHVGSVRDNNEDAFLTSGQDLKDAQVSWSGPLGPDGWALIADGMGGHVAGEVASKIAVRSLSTALADLTAAEEVASAIEATNVALFDAMERRPELHGMGTTIAGVRFFGGAALIFNAGDSRIYKEVNGALRQVSEDHVVGGYMLTKCLGGTSVRTPVEPFITSADLPSGSRLLLCSDGITDELSDETIGGLLHEENPADALVAAALAAGGRDNATVVVLVTTS
jgi:protein phosphatase